jgi:pimeloyl-ACP methyl ester carboxylesterase
VTLRDPGRDPDHPAALVDVAVESGGARLNGVAYVPAGPGPHPGVLILHGLPGYERNLDLAQALRRAGWTSMVVHYRGAWGSGGEFSFAHVLEDALAALEHLRSASMREVLRVDPARVAIVGHSMGGWAALLTGARSEVLGTVSIAGFDLGAVARRLAGDPGFAAWLHDTFEPQMAPLAGASSDRLFAEAAGAGDAWAVARHAERFAGRPVLLLAATHDEEVPLEMHHEPMVTAFERAGAVLTHRALETDHAYSDRRVELAETIAGWLGGLST